MSINDLQIQPATISDISAIAQFNIDLAFETESIQLADDIVFEGVKTVIENPEHGFYLIARNQSSPVASLLITYEWSDWRNGQIWWIQSVFVIDEWRRLGVFNMLYQEISKKANKAKHVCGIRLYVDNYNNAAKEVYRRIGMRETNYRLFEAID